MRFFLGCRLWASIFRHARQGTGRAGIEMQAGRCASPPVCCVRLIGLEPTRPEPPDPKSGASTNSATSALFRRKDTSFSRNFLFPAGGIFVAGSNPAAAGCKPLPAAEKIFAAAAVFPQGLPSSASVCRRGRFRGLQWSAPRGEKGLPGCREPISAAAGRRRGACARNFVTLQRTGC